MERYLITGAQLGILQGLVAHKDFEKLLGIIDEIMDKQFLGNSPDRLEDDVEIMSKFFYRTREDIYEQIG